MPISAAASSDRGAGGRRRLRAAAGASGLTLLEMTVVLMVVGLLVAVGVPRFAAFVAAEREAAAVRQVRAELLQLGALARVRVEPIGLRPAAGARSLDVVRWEPPARRGDPPRVRVLASISWLAAPVRIEPHRGGLMPAELEPDPTTDAARRWLEAIWWEPSGVSGGGVVRLPAPAQGGEWNLVIAPFTAAVRLEHARATGATAR